MLIVKDMRYLDHVDFVDYVDYVDYLIMLIKLIMLIMLMLLFTSDLLEAADWGRGSSWDGGLACLGWATWYHFFIQFLLLNVIYLLLIVILLLTDQGLSGLDDLKLCFI